MDQIYFIIAICIAVISILIWQWMKTRHAYYLLERDYAILHTRFEDNVRSYEEKIGLLDETKSQMKLEFAHLASEIFEQKTKTFDETHKQGLDMLLKPFREQINEFALQSREQFVHDAKGDKVSKTNCFASNHSMSD